MLVNLYPSVVMQPNGDTIPSRICDDTKMFSYFKGYIGAPDGTHIRAHIPKCDVGRLRSPKGEVSQNVLRICTFDALFCYVLPGWEGSAHDTSVLNAGLAADLWTPPPGRYYLVDAGYHIQAGFLLPYRGVRYPLKEQYQSQQKPANKKELFNLRHAQLWEVIKRIFGIVKPRFLI